MSAIGKREMIERMQVALTPRAITEQRAGDSLLLMLMLVCGNASSNDVDVVVVCGVEEFIAD